MGTIELYFDWDFEKARADTERAVALSPHDMLTRHAYGDYLMLTGRLEDSLTQVQLGRLANPSSPMAQFIALFHTMATRDADAALLWRAGKQEEALVEYRAAWDPGLFRTFEQGFRRAGPRGALVAYAEALLKAQDAGRPAAWLAVAGVYAEAGEADAAFGYLEKAFAARPPQLLHIVVDPAFDGVRSDPRYDALLRRIGIPMARRAR